MKVKAILVELDYCRIQHLLRNAVILPNFFPKSVDICSIPCVRIYPFINSLASQFHFITRKSLEKCSFTKVHL